MNKVLITGATGFIGGRLAEVLYGKGVESLCLVRNWSGASRLARMPIKMVGGNILDPFSLRSAMSGCDVVFHCAVDNRAEGKAHTQAHINGTANVMQAALEMGVGRVVHLSSTAVFGYQPLPDAATEAGAYRHTGDIYCDGKIESEKITLNYWQKHSLPVTVLRPSVVYGPYSYLANVIPSFLKDGRMLLIDGGAGICNSLYIDNLVEAMLAAAVNPEAPGQVFHISDAAPVSWKKFVEGHAAALGASYLPIREISKQEIEELWNRQKAARGSSSSLKQALNLMRDPLFRRSLNSVPLIKFFLDLGKSTVRTLLPPERRRTFKKTLLGTRTGTRPSMDNSHAESAPVLSRSEAGIFSTFDNLTFKIDKAERLLGYVPSIDFEEGMRRTAAWIKWSKGI